MPGSECPKAVHCVGSDHQPDDTRETVIVRIGTEEDLFRFYGKQPIFSTRAVVAELNGEIIAIGGVYRNGTQIYGFSEMKEAMRGRRKAMARMVRLGLPILARYVRVLAFANPAEPTAKSFLTSLGFEHHGPSEQGEVYIWNRSAHSPGPSERS